MRLFKKSVREIGNKNSSIAGMFISRKNEKKSVQFESTLERDFIYLIEYDSSVEEYVEQPVTINYFDRTGKHRRYTPDFYVRYKDSDRKDELIEIKYHKYLLENSLLLNIKFEAAREFCENNNLIFKVLTEKDIREKDPIYLKNIIFILGYRDLFEILETSEYLPDRLSRELDILINRLSELGKSPISKLLSSFDFDDWKSAEYLYYIWYLISKRYVGCNLHQQLNINSLIWVI